MPNNSAQDEPVTHPLLLTKAECAVILQIRQLPFGSIEVKVQDGVPVAIEEVRRKIRLA